MRMTTNFMFRVGALGLVLVIAGIMIMISSGADKANLKKGVQDINTLGISDFEEGRFYNGTIGTIIDEFATETTYNSTFGIKSNERVSKHYYLIRLEGDDTRFAAVETGNEAFVNIANTMMDETWSDAEIENYTTVDFYGKAMKMDKELKDLLYEYYDELFEYMNITDVDYAAVTVPYVLTYQTKDTVGKNGSMGVVLLLVGAAILGFIVFMFIKSRGSAPAPDVNTQDVNVYNVADNSGYVPAHAAPANDTGASGYIPTHAADQEQSSSYSDAGSSDFSDNI